jgi:hypothetical protein
MTDSGGVHAYMLGFERPLSSAHSAQSTEARSPSICAIAGRGPSACSNPYSARLLPGTVIAAVSEAIHVTGRGGVMDGFVAEAR